MSNGEYDKFLHGMDKQTSEEFLFPLYNTTSQEKLSEIDGGWDGIQDGQKKILYKLNCGILCQVDIMSIDGFTRGTDILMVDQSINGY